MTLFIFILNSLIIGMFIVESLLIRICLLIGFAVVSFIFMLRYVNKEEETENLINFLDVRYQELDKEIKKLKDEISKKDRHE